MKWHTEYHWFNTRNKREFVNITDLVRKAVRKVEIQEGMVLVSAMHITAGVFVNDEEEGLKADLMDWAEELALLSLITVITTPGKPTEMPT